MDGAGKKFTTTIAGGAIILGLASFGSRLLGLARESLLFSTFGADDTLDAYYAAFKVPDFIFNLVVLGALSSAFVPIFLDVWQKEHARAWQVANTVLNVILLILIFFCAVLFFLSPFAVDIVAPGFDTQKAETTEKMMRIMLLGVIFFGLSNIASGILNSFRRFIGYAIAPIIYNVGIIIGILFFVPRWGVVGLAWGVVLGSFLHFVVQVPSLRTVGYRYRLQLSVKIPEVRRMVRLMIPRTIGLAAAQVNLIVMTSVASHLTKGSVAALSVANNLQYLPISVFGISLAIAAFPEFSEAYVQKDEARFVQGLSKSIRRIFFFTLPVSVAIILFRAQIVRLVLGHGKFTWEDTVMISQTLGVFAISLFAQSVIPVLARSFYARQNTITPLLIGVFSVAVNIVLAMILPKFEINGEALGVVGLATAFTIASLINMMGLFIALRREVGFLDEVKIFSSLTRIMLATALFAITAQLGKYALAPVLGDFVTTIALALQVMGAAGLGVGVYILASLWFHGEEMDIVRSSARRLLRIFR